MFQYRDIQKIEIGLTSRCNLNECVYCFRSQATNKIPNMDLDYWDITRELEALRDQLQSIKICGTLGDPILYPHILYFLSYISDFGCQMEVSTNGNPHNRDWWFNLAKKVGKHINMIFCLDGIDTYDVYRKGGSFEKVFSNMKAYINGGGTASWKFIMFEHNIHEMEKAINLARNIQCKYFIQVISGIYDQNLQKPRNLNIPEYDCIRCQSLEEKSISVDADGGVMPCCGFKPVKSIINKDFSMTNDIKLLMAWGKEKEQLNIHTSTIKNAMQTEFFKYVINNYSKIPKCVYLCRTTRRDEGDFYERIEL